MMELKQKPAKRQEVRDLVGSLRAQPVTTENIENMINCIIDLAVIEALAEISQALKMSGLR